MNRNIYVWVAIAAIVIGGASLGYWLGGRDSAPDVEDNLELAPDLVSIPPALPEFGTDPDQLPRRPGRLRGVNLKTSDEPVRELVSEVAPDPELVSWLANEDLVRRAAAAVANIAAGKSPGQVLDFLAPSNPFAVVERDGEQFIDPRTYQRYDRVANVIAGLDVANLVFLYQELAPLIGEAYREIGPPGANFDEVLQAAIKELLATPVPLNEERVETKVVTYTYADPELEALSEAQRQLLRMGPGNVRKIQAKLRELAAALAAG